MVLNRRLTREGFCFSSLSLALKCAKEAERALAETMFFFAARSAVFLETRDTSSPGSFLLVFPSSLYDRAWSLTLLRSSAGL